MKLLDKRDYYKVRIPLKEVAINHLFARSVVEKNVDGCVYVDNKETPTTFLVVHPYGMSLLFGKTSNDEFNSWFLDYAFNTFKIRNKYEWLQAYPDSWNRKLSILFKDDRIDEYTRVNFKFNRVKYLDFKSKIAKNDYKVIRVDREMYEKIEGAVVPKYFWNSAEQFFYHGVGFSLIYQHKLASTAYSSFIHDKQLELGIETMEKYRRMEFAVYTCSVLIDYCLANDFEPVWSCQLENTGSYKLAQKLGFEPTLYTPYFRLNK
jgi:hypothetical protein